jgi:hypothetical protein
LQSIKRGIELAHELKSTTHFFSMERSRSLQLSHDFFLGRSWLDQFFSSARRLGRMGNGMTAGGKRKGAGRKPLALDQRAVGVTVRLRPQVAARFRAWCKGRGISQSEAFSTWVLHLIA